MGLETVQTYTNIGWAYADNIQSTLQQFGAIISSNRRSHITVQGAQDHIDVPAYPETTPEGIAHFIHFAKPLIDKDTPRRDVLQIMTQHMSKVCRAYATHILTAKSTRFNSRLAA